MEEINGRDVRNIVEILDNFAKSGEGRMKIKMADDMENSSITKEYHHGRCDVGSPWACENGLDKLDE